MGGTEQTRTARFGRRAFFVRAGLIGAAAALGETALRQAGTEPADALAPLFDTIATDTINGLVAFVVPGPDRYSVHQGVSDTLPGGIAADGTAFMLNALDNFYPVPAEPMRLLVQAFATALTDSISEIPPSLKVPLSLAAEIDLAVENQLAEQGTVPLSALVALLLNLVATMAAPASVVGPFFSPFANCTFAQKEQAFALIEQEAATVTAEIDANLSEPLKETFSGLLEFLAGALLEFAAFGSYNEFGVFDAKTRQLTGAPVGWRLSNYLAATNFTPVEGWNEFKGYLGGRTSATEGTI